MAHWDGSRRIDWPPLRDEFSPSWIRFDCGCCAGIQWGGDEPRECGDCGGLGCLSVHEPSGTVAQYPGGPLAGAHMRSEDLQRLLRGL